MKGFNLLVCPECDSKKGFIKTERTESYIGYERELWDELQGDDPTTELVGITCVNCGEYFRNDHSELDTTVEDVIAYSKEQVE